LVAQYTGSVLKILFCNERFTFRFGVDRVLLLLAEGLKSRGHEISIAANRVDREVVSRLTNRLIEVPPDGAPYIDLNEFTADWIRKNLAGNFPNGELPDVALIGGWPFIAAIPVFQSMGIRVVFNDYGVVPLDSYSGGHLAVLQKLSALRRQHMPSANLNVAISKFIRDSQSAVDSPDLRTLAVGLLGADHMEQHLWKASEVPASSDATPNHASPFGKSFGQRKPIKILNLGRWEPGCYKNSDAIFEFLDRMESAGIDAVVYILANHADADVPHRLKEHVVPLGFPDALGGFWNFGFTVGGIQSSACRDAVG
jgi:hypothetical protein